jgi:hypothetical protein
MADLRHDVRIRRLINKYGIEGYGLYIAILESITSTLETDTPIPDLEENAQDMAEYFKMDTVKVEEIILFCMNQSLFEQDEITGRIICKKIYKFIEQSQTRSVELRNMITKFKGYKPEELSEIVLDKSEEENRKEKKRIEYSIYGEFNNVKLTNEEFNKLVSMYSLKTIQDKIQDLSLYIKSKGKKYSSHYATIQSWLRKDGVYPNKQTEVKHDPKADIERMKKEIENGKSIL